MQVPGMNPLQNSTSIGPTQSPTGVPDLILNSPQQRAPAQARPDAPTQAPFQAPDQAQIQHVQQSLTHALMEMNMPPTAQNLQMAQLLANYGHPVSQHTLAILKNAMAGLTDKSSAAMEAATILLTQDLPVNDKTVAAMKQLMNGQSLPQQLQNLPQNLGQVMQKLQQVANPASQASGPTVSPEVQQLAQQVQGGVVTAQQAAGSSALQQAAGKAQATEVDTAQGAEKSTAQKLAIQPIASAPQSQDKAKVQTPPAAPSPESLPALSPSAKPAGDQQGLSQLFLYLQGQEPEFFTLLQKMSQGTPAQQKMAQLFESLQNILHLARHLGENMQLKDFSHLPVQHQQIMQLTDLLSKHLEVFRQQFQNAFPELAKQVGLLLQQDGMDMLSKLSQLLEDNQQQLARLKEGTLPEEQVITTLRQLMEQVGVQVEKIQTHLLGRELLSQNLPVHCIPLTIHAHGESYPAELYIQQDYDPEDPHSGPDSERPLKLTLTLETQNLGRVAVDIATLKESMNVDLKVLSRRVKNALDERLDKLKQRLEAQGNYTLDHLSCRVIQDLESRQSMLLPPQYPVRSLRRVEGIV